MSNQVFITGALVNQFAAADMAAQHARENLTHPKAKELVTIDEALNTEVKNVLKETGDYKAQVTLYSRPETWEDYNHRVQIAAGAGRVNPSVQRLLHDFVSAGKAYRKKVNVPDVAFQGVDKPLALQ